VPGIATLGASTVDGILDDIMAVGNTLDVDDADELVIGLRSRMAKVHRALKAAQAPRPRVLVLEWTDPPFNAGHWVPDMVRRAGGQEVLGQVGEVSRRVHEDEIRSAQPEVVIVAPCGYGLQEAKRETHALLSRDVWSLMPDVPVWALDANALTSSPGPGVVHGIEVFARLLHPVLFGAPSPHEALRIAP
jgi:iron complex transport system substrate-binding protein